MQNNECFKSKVRLNEQLDKRERKIPQTLVHLESLNQKIEIIDREVDEMKSNLVGLNGTMASLKEDMKEKDEARDRTMDEINASLIGLVEDMANLKRNLSRKYGKRI